MYARLFVFFSVLAHGLAFADDAVQLPTLTVIGKPSLNEDEEAEKTNSYSTPSSSTATRSKMANRDIPQSIEVRTKQFWRDLGGQQRTDEIAKYVPGVNVTWYGNGGTNVPILNYRGFSNTSGYGETDFMKDGYRKLSGIATTMDLANVERIEFLKGPSSVVFGKSESLGGAMNIISKRPLLSQRQHFDFTLGSFDFYRTTMDVGTPLNKSKSALFRMNAAFEDADSFRDFANHRSYLIAPSFSFDITDDDRVTLLLDYNESNLKGEFGVPITPVFAQVPRATYLQDPNFDRTEVSALNTLVEYQHRFNPDWQITAGISTSKSEWKQDYSRFYKDFTSTNPFQAVRDPNHETDNRYTQNIEATLTGKLRFAQMDHQLMLGGGYIYTRDDSTNQQGLNNVKFDIRNPVYNQTYTFSNPVGRGIYNSDNFTLYAQDLVTVLPQLKILLGMRYDHVYRITTQDNFFGASGNDSQTDEQVSPRFGIIYQPSDATSLYGSYSTSFAQRINFFLDPNERFKPETGEQFEIGLKQKLTPALDLNVALYQLTRKNVVQPDLNTPNPRDTIQTGVQSSRGLEVSLVGHITDDFRLTGAYSFLKAKVLRDNQLPRGDERVGVPQHNLNLFGVYSFSGALAGLELGSGINYSSSAQVSMPNTFKLPDTFQWDALLSYRFHPNYKIQVNVKNITDENNYIVAQDFGYISIGPPRSVYATFSADF